MTLCVVVISPSATQVSHITRPPFSCTGLQVGVSLHITPATCAMEMPQRSVVHRYERQAEPSGSIARAIDCCQQWIAGGVIAWRQAGGHGILVILSASCLRTGT